MTRGRRPDPDLEPSRQLLTQRAFRQRRAAHLAELEETVMKLERENASLKGIEYVEPDENQKRGKGHWKRIKRELEIGGNNDSKSESDSESPERNKQRNRQKSSSPCESCMRHDQERQNLVKAAAAVDSCLLNLSQSMRILRQTLEKQQVEKSKVTRRPSTATSTKYSPIAAPINHHHHQHHHVLPKGQPYDHLSSHNLDIPHSLPSISHSIQTPVNATKTPSSQYFSTESNERRVSNHSNSSHLGNNLRTTSPPQDSSSCCGGATQCVSSNGSIIQESESRPVNIPSSNRGQEERYSHHKSISAPIFKRPRIEIESATTNWQQQVNIPQLDESKCCLGLLECDSQGNIIIQQEASS